MDLNSIAKIRYSIVTTRCAICFDAIAAINDGFDF